MPPRTLNRLTDVTIRKAGPGWHADGGGLYLRAFPDGKRWVFVFRWAGKRSEMGLGPITDLTLAEARLERDKWRKVVRAGLNPITERRRERADAASANAPTFAAWATEMAPVHAPRAAKAHAAWLRMMTEWTGPIRTMPVNEIRTDDVMAALKPYWISRPETGRRMQQRIAKLLDAAHAKGVIAEPWSNPADWKSRLVHLMERQGGSVQHHKAVPYTDAPAFVGELADRDSMAAHALMFTILTAARTSETLRATWAEMDLDAKVWTVPAARMKGGRVHRVPLSDAALGVLAKVTPPNGRKRDYWVFPSMVRKGAPMSNGAMERIMDDMGWRGKATVHGWRSAFRDWAGDCTDVDRATVEAALAHAVGDAVERSYRRSDALLKRADLMGAWAVFLG